MPYKSLMERLNNVKTKAGTELYKFFLDDLSLNSLNQLFPFGYLSH
jgi:hypothetical protein